MKTINMMQIARNIDKAKQRSGKTWTEVLHRIGWERSTLSRVLRSQRHPRIDTLLKLAEGIGCDIVQFFGYDSASRPVIEQKLIISEKPLYGENIENFVPVPLLSDPASLGPGLEIEEANVDGTCLIHRRVLKKTGEYQAIFVRGDSMSPVLNDGDIVALDVKDRNSDRLKGKLVACHTGDYEVTIKSLRIYKDRFYFKALNPKWEEENVPMITAKKDGLILGKVVWAWKKFD